MKDHITRLVIRRRIRRTQRIINQRKAAGRQYIRAHLGHV